MTLPQRAMSFRYRLEYGSYYLYADYGDYETLVQVCDQIAMAYDPDTFTLLKHGSPSKIDEWITCVRHYEIPVNVITFAKEFPIEEINKILSTSGYLKYVINEPANKHTIS